MNLNNHEKVQAKILFTSSKPKSLLSLFLYSLLLILFSPFHILGLTTNYLPYKTPVWFVNSKVKDKHFHSSLKMALGYCFSIYIGLLSPLYFHNFWLEIDGILFFITLPPIAAFNYKYWIYFIKIRGLWIMDIIHHIIKGEISRLLRYYKIAIARHCLQISLFIDINTL